MNPFETFSDDSEEQPTPLRWLPAIGQQTAFLPPLAVDETVVTTLSQTRIMSGPLGMVTTHYEQSLRAQNGKVVSLTASAEVTFE